MFELTAQCTREYLTAQGQTPRSEIVTVEALAGGISNQVLRVCCADPGHDMVLKQARHRLRTKAPWFAALERIYREADTLRRYAAICSGGHVPRVIFEDRENYVLALSAAPRESTTWKTELVGGRFDKEIAATCGKIMSAVHAATWENPADTRQFADREFFEQLRIDPYYRAVAVAAPESASFIDALIRSVADHPLALVHGDFSPKNLLVFAGGPLLIDYECGHFGDPAFDVGFFLSHLALKSFLHESRATEMTRLIDAFFAAYVPPMRSRVSAIALEELAERSVINVIGCMWARIDGKSRVDYLTDDDERERVRDFCRRLAGNLRRDVPEFTRQLERELSSRGG